MENLSSAKKPAKITEPIESDGVKQVTNSKAVGKTQLLQFAVVCLAIASFFTTAQGMHQYIFDNPTIAYVTSGAIQGILLALSMNLPKFMKRIWGENNGFLKGVGKLLIEVVLLLLTAVSLFCSSWFSYVYIAETVHKGSWNTDSRLLVQQTYRSELYSTNDYAKAYRAYLETELGQKILNLQTLANQLPTQASDFNMDWNAERQNYASDNTMANSLMSTVIDQMENAFVTSPSQENRNLAAQAVEQAQGNVEQQMQRNQQRINNLNDELTTVASRIQNLERQIRNAGANTDTTLLYNSLNSNYERQNSLTERQQEIQNEISALQRAEERLGVYAVNLGLSNSTSSISIKSNLIELQTELFSNDPDDQKLKELATDTFKNLRSSEAMTETDANGDSSLSYSTLLTQMNALVLNLNDYSNVKSVEKNLNVLMTELRGGSDVSIGSMRTDTSSASSASDSSSSSSASTSSSSTSLSGAENAGTERTNQPADAVDHENNGEATAATGSDGNNTVEPNTENGNAVAQPEDNATASSTVSAASGTESQQDNQKDTQEIDTTWKKTWLTRIEVLKAQISALPSFIGSSADVSELTATQQAKLTSFDRDTACNALDNVTRRYINTHNALEQGTIYLTSPYKGLALFALMLAFFLDLAGFVFGVVDLGNQPENTDNNSNVGEKTEKKPLDINSIIKNAKAKVNSEGNSWSINPTMNHYIVVTEQFRHEDGVYYYSAFENGIRKEWEVCDGAEYHEGIYTIADPVKKQGKPLEKKAQNIIFENQVAGMSAQDGIYLNGKLSYSEGSLLFEPDNAGENSENMRAIRYIANVEEYVPVHCYNPRRSENITQPAIDLGRDPIDAEMAVLALNKKGTRIVAVYVIKKV